MTIRNEAEAREILKKCNGNYLTPKETEAWFAKGYVTALEGPEVTLLKELSELRLRDLNKYMKDNWDKDRRIQELEKIVKGKYLSPCPMCEDPNCIHNELHQRDKRIKELEEKLDRNESQIAGIADLANSWARECGVDESNNPYDNYSLRSLIGRLWDESATRWLNSQQKISDQKAMMEKMAEALKKNGEHVLACLAWDGKGAHRWSKLDESKCNCGLQEALSEYNAWKEKNK
jgi:hypothetical protein